MEKIADLLFEAGMLCKTPRSGYQFLGSGSESVAEHILRTVFVGYALCKMNPSLNEPHVLKMCILHDLPEARTGDMNYVNKKYVEVNEAKAIGELTEGLSFGEEIRSVIDEFNARQTPESRAARDADQLALILQLKECGDLGNKYSEEWIRYALKRLSTEEGQKLADQILRTDSAHWWFKDKSDWWINGSHR